MDDRGVVWCEKNIELQADFLEESAELLGLPFSRIVGRRLVKIAIYKAKRSKQNELGLRSSHNFTPSTGLTSTDLKQLSQSRLSRAPSVH